MPATIDSRELARRLDALRAELEAEKGPEDRHHFLKMAWLGQLSGLLGLGSAWLAINPVSILLLSLGRFIRWTMVGHHVCHKGYDRVPGMPPRYTSKRFALGSRRFLDWFDWIHPRAWSREHNHLHHYRLGETADPDQPEMNFEPMMKVPPFLRWLALPFFMVTWKYLYYAPNTVREWHRLTTKEQGSEDEVGFFDARLWLPWATPGWKVWWSCWVPYTTWNFLLLPSLFLPLGQEAAVCVLVNQLFAEMLTNAHSFLVIVPNHVGDDVYRFDQPTKSKGEFYLRQILGSVNYPSGSDGIDLFHGWLNYQIEHHLWPNLTMLQYRRAQPRVQALCAEFGLPYIQESVWKRFAKTVSIAVGRKKMPWWDRADAAIHPQPEARGLSKELQPG